MPTWSSCRSRSTRGTWPRACGPATGCRWWPPYTEGARRGQAVVLLPTAEVIQVLQDPAGLTGAGQERLDLTDLLLGGFLDDPAESLCSEALARMREDAAAHAPIIVLTEGRTDIQVLQPALDLLYPHLTDLIRFMDYAERPEGGAGALVRTVRAFAAAGVVNRVVALFDNDTAATDALRNLDINELPAGFLRCS